MHAYKSARTREPRVEIILDKIYKVEDRHALWIFLDFSFWLVLLFRQEPGPDSDHWCPLRHTLAEVWNIQISHKFQKFTKLNWSYVSLKGWALLDKLSFGEIYGQFVKSLLQHGARRLRGIYVNCELEVYVSVPLREGKCLIRTQFCTNANVFFSNRWSVGEREIIITTFLESF